MKTINLKSIILGILILVLFLSCNKENDSISHNAIVLADKPWRFEIYGLDENNNGVIDDSENDMQSCEADDVFTFDIDRTGFLSRGTTVCSVGEAAIVSFNWSFSNNETELAIFAAPEKISKLDEITLEVYYMDQNLQGQPVKYIRRFRH